LTEVVAPNSVFQNDLGWGRIYAADPAICFGIKIAELSERLDPLSLEAMNCLNLRAAAHLFSRRFDVAIDAAERALGRAPDYNSARRCLIASLVHAGCEEDARTQTKELLRRDPRCTLARTRGNNPFRHEWMIEFFLEGLARAGVPSG
jgi:hypothetical protein